MKKLDKLLKKRWNRSLRKWRRYMKLHRSVDFLPIFNSDNRGGVIVEHRSDGDRETVTVLLTVLS